MKFGECATVCVPGSERLVFGPMATQAAPRPLDRRSGKTLRAPVIAERLMTRYDGGVVELDWTTPFELLVATILSAQSTDKKVNELTPALFARFPDPGAFVAAPAEEVEQMIYQTGFYRQKTRSLQGMSAALIERHGGEVPRTMRELIALPGVARKTANVVLGAAHPEAHAADPDAGIAVDTHVKRLSRRFGFTTHTDPDKIEKDLMRLLPKEQWSKASLAIILHGRRVCDARRPRCADCGVEELCPSSLAAGCRDKAKQAQGMGS
jgi:endonuclease III